MKKGKIFIIITVCLMLSLIGFLAVGFVSWNDKSKKNQEASAQALSPSTVIENNMGGNNGKYTYIPPIFEYDDNNIGIGGEGSDMYDDELSDTWVPAEEMDLNPESITVYVNKEFALPKDYVPSDLTIPNIPFDIAGFEERKQLRAVAAAAIEELFAAAERDGYILYGISGYRSYERQKTIFLNNIVNRGKAHTLKYSAVPGTSEHQTGLAMDLSSKSMRYRLITTFATCPEGKWLSQHAHEYGYIIRYPKNRIDVTGYAYEPWHIRYVGKNLAKYLYDNNLTLDEYYRYTPSEDFDFEAVYADLINYVPPVTPTPSPTPSPTPTPVPETFVKGSVLEGDITLPAGAFLNGSVVLSDDIVLSDGTALAAGTILKGIVILPENAVLEGVIKLSKDTVSKSSIVLPNRCILDAGIPLPAGTILESGIIMPDGDVLQSTVTLPEYTLLEGGVLLPKGTSISNYVLLKEVGPDNSDNKGGSAGDDSGSADDNGSAGDDNGSEAASDISDGNNPAAPNGGIKEDDGKKDTASGESSNTGSDASKGAASGDIDGSNSAEEAPLDGVSLDALN